MEGWAVLATVLGLQLGVAAVIIYVLKRCLDKDLCLNALEQALGFHPSEEVRRTGKVSVIAAGKLPVQLEAQLASALKEKCPSAEIKFLENPALKGGLVVEIAGEIWDHSLITRIRHLF